MPWLTDDPFPIYAACGITLVVLLVLLLKTGRGVILVAMVGVLFCIIAASVIDRIVVTDRERVEQTLFEAAALAEQNRLDDLLNYISPSVLPLRLEARRWIGQASKIESVSVSAIDVTVDREKTPPTARAEFRVFVQGLARDRSNSFPFKYLQRIGVDFRLEGDRWMVVDYQRGP
ncbi:MAG: hypothetical protein IT427_17580 [Pirellulales bacterium]|nr:hypothetical protein [Pirellulales bacterium]